MKTFLAFLALLVVATSAFTVPVPSSFAPTPRTAVLFSEPEDAEGELDLDLEEMFTMFDAADKEEEFEKAIKKVKKDE
jgi:hypothetical protein